MRAPMLHMCNKGFLKHCEENKVKANGYWYPARPLSAASFRGRCYMAWLVFTGKADALMWPGQCE